jgi:hypothetical protein
VQDKSVFIPHSPLTEAERIEKRKQFETMPISADYTFEEVFGDDANLITYRDSDIRSALVGLQATDEMFSLCSNSIMSGATRLVFISPPNNNTVTVKFSACRPVAEGLNCLPVEPVEKYFYKKPEHFFSLGVGLSYSEAERVLSAFESRGIKDLPEWYRAFTFSSVNRMEKSPDGYLLLLGEVYCGGCTADLVVQFDPLSKEDELVLVKDPKGMCI